MADNEYYNDSGAPGNRAQLSSSQIRAELARIKAGFDLLPTVSKLTSGATNSATVTGSANAYQAAISTVTSYSDLQRYTLKINITNTGATTLQINALGTRTVKRLDGSDLQAGDISAGNIYDFGYNATNNTIVLMSLMPDTVQSSNPVFTTMTSTLPAVAPTYKGAPAELTIADGNLAIPVDTGNLFYASITEDCTVTLTAEDSTRSYEFTIVATTTGAYTFTSLAMSEVTIYRGANPITLKASGRTVLGCIYNGAAGTLDVFLQEMVTLS